MQTQRPQRERQEEEIILGAAGRPRQTSPAIISHAFPLQNNMLAAPSPRRTQSSPSKVCNMHRHSDPSCSHASALARSLLAIGTTNLAAKNEEDEFWESGQEPPQFQLNREPGFSKFLASPQSLVPSSAFSDYGSSECSSVAYTPSDSDNEDDPFEFDNVSRQPSLSFDSNARVVEQPPPDNFKLFAAAIQMNSLSNDFVLPSFPPQKLVERRPNRFGSDVATQSAAASTTTPEDPFAASFANELRLSTPSSQSSQQEVLPSSSSGPIMDNTLAARRRRPDTNVFLFRSNSFAGTPDSRQTPQTISILRRINTDDANFGRISKTSSTSPVADDICPDTAVTVRPRRRSSSTRPRPLSEMLRAGPLTPTSPPNPVDETTSHHHPPPPEPQTKQQQHTHEISPPTTPQMPSAALDDTSIPRRLVWYDNCNSYSDDEDAFTFDFYALPLPSAGPAAMLTASIASSTTCGDRAFF